MDRDAARQEIRRNWKQLYPADGKGKGIICPLCGSGSGHNGTGITENPRKPGQLKCWACDFQGDVLDLIQQERGADYNTALQTAAAALGITIDPYRESPEQAFAALDIENLVLEENGAYTGKTEGQAGQSAGKTEEGPNGADTGVRRPTKDYIDYYIDCNKRLSDPAALSYLRARGISFEIAEGQLLGYDPAADPAQTGKHKTPRIIIPTSVSHYIGRSIDPATPKEYAKMNVKGGSPDIFNRGALYGEKDPVFVTEGAFDCLSLLEVGSAAIALNSTSNADKLIKKLQERPTDKTLVLCLDKDAAGKKAQQTLTEGLKRLNISYVTADICGGCKDPNDALVTDKTAFMQAVKKAEAQTAARPDNVRSYITDLMQEDIDRLKAAADRKTGFEELDKISGGLYPGLYVIAATSSLGKTTFSHQIADNLAAAGNDVLFFSLEQSRLELVSKSLARIAYRDMAQDLTSLQIRKGQYQDVTRAAAQQYLSTVGERMNIIEGNFSCNIAFIGEYIRRYIRRNNCSPVIFIDYLQILQPAEDVNNRHTSIKETIDNVVTELKRISREHDLTVFIISSVNRANYLTPIDFESLKESGSVEYTADVIWGLQLQCLNSDLFNSEKKIKEKRQKIREEKAADPRKIELLCLKNRYGISSYSAYFDYYPKHDLYINTPEIDFSDFQTYTGQIPF